MGLLNSALRTSVCVGTAAVGFLGACDSSERGNLFSGSGMPGIAGQASVSGQGGLGGDAGSGLGGAGGSLAGSGAGGTAEGAPVLSGSGGSGPSSGSGGLGGGESTSDAGGEGGSEGVSEPTCLAEHIIDDLEDRNDAICRTDGHVGRWFTNNDGTSGAIQDPPLLAVVRPEPVLDRPGSNFAVRTSGSGFRTWGATLGFDIRASDDTAYDASAFSAITFYAKGTVNGKVRVSVRLRDFAPPDQGGNCDTDRGNCFRYHGADLSVTEEWEQYRVRFDRLVREDNWDPAFDPTQLVGVEFRVPIPASQESFELWIDDVAFEPTLE